MKFKSTNWILWIGGIFNENAMLKHNAISPAANRWQSGLVNAISRQKISVITFSYLPEPIWPKGQCRPGDSFDIDNRFNNHLIRYWNIPFIRTHSLTQIHTKTLNKICKQHSRPLAVISYNPTSWGIATGLFAQKYYQIPWIDVCADHYDVDDSWSQYPIKAKLAAGHVFLSHYAFKNCPFKEKLFLEGGITPLESTSIIQSSKKLSNEKIILYTGMLEIWGGIDFLLKAFELIHDPNIKLWICGHGNNPNLKKALKKDPRIHFWGIVSESQLQEITHQASVLINPRPSNISGNAMNFPSKILEYLRYEKPIISTWTLGFSPEYRDILVILDRETEICLANTIKDVLKWDKKKIYQNAKKIKEFILKQKTWACQATRLINWIMNNERTS